MGEINNQVAFNPGPGMDDKGRPLAAPILDKPTGFNCPIGFDLTPLDKRRVETPPGEETNQKTTAKDARAAMLRFLEDFEAKQKAADAKAAKAARLAEAEKKKAELKAHTIICNEKAAEILAACAEARFGYQVIAWESVSARHTLDPKNGHRSGYIHFLGSGLCDGGYWFTVSLQLNIKNGEAERYNLRGDTVLKVEYATEGFRANIRPQVLGFWFDRPDAGFWAHQYDGSLKRPAPRRLHLSFKDLTWRDLIWEMVDELDVVRRLRKKPTFVRSIHGKQDVPQLTDQMPEVICLPSPPEETLEDTGGLAYQVAQIAEAPSLLEVMADHLPT